MNENIIPGVVVALIGILTVFSVLAILWGVLEIMRAIFSTAQKKPAEKKATPAPTTAPAPVAPAAVPAPESDDEIIAVLTAAVAAMLNKPTSGLQIRSYRRVDGSAPIWNRAARQDNLIR